MVRLIRANVPALVAVCLTTMLLVPIWAQERLPTSPFPTGKKKTSMGSFGASPAAKERFGGFGGPGQGPGSVAPRFHFEFKDDAPVEELLPFPPAVSAKSYVGDDLTLVPEVAFSQPIAVDDKRVENLGHTIAKVNHLNRKKADHFMTVLLDRRPDLGGLPVTMGDSCRSSAERSEHFGHAVGRVREALNQQVQMSVAEAARAPARAAEVFWSGYDAACVSDDHSLSKLTAKQRESLLQCRIAALMQLLAPESSHLRAGLVRHLAGISHREATRALARLAIFSAEEEIRTATIDALKLRRERDYGDILAQALRYPWPAVAERAGKALARLERRDLALDLVALLDEPDPRGPVLEDVGGHKRHVARELVRLNHNRNCLLCHAPFDLQGDSRPQAIVAMPVPGNPMPAPSQGYQRENVIPDILVRFDVTYLRPDFSHLHPVANADPWPEMQRFDYVVRKRLLTEPEARELTAALPRESPYVRTALAALRELTGRDEGSAAASWRRALSP